MKRNLKLDPNDDEDDSANSKKNTQEELEKLYKGEEFEGDKAFSRMLSTLFVLIMYSGGMPVLYPIGYLFFFVTFFVQKTMIISYY